MAINADQKRIDLKIQKLLTKIDKQKKALDESYVKLVELQKQCKHKFKKVSETSEICKLCRKFDYWDHPNSW